MEPDLQQSPLFARGPSSNARLILLAMASVLMMMADHRGHYLDRIRSGATIVAFPLQKIAAFPWDAGQWITTQFTSRRDLSSENEKLKQRNLLARGQLQRLAALRAENERLRALLDTARERPERLEVAEIERVDLDPYNHRVLIDRGSSDDVFEGQPLLDENGVMGQIVSVGPVSAYAMLISDPNHAIPVRVNRTGLRTIAFGTGRTDELVINDLPLSADVRRGDLLVTSGLGGRFPAGFPVARVARVERDPGKPFAQVIAAPAAALDRSRLVLLVWPQDEPEDTPPNQEGPK